MSVLLTLNICKREKNLAKECSEMRVIDLSVYILYDINFQKNVAEIWTKKFVLKVLWVTRLFFLSFFLRILGYVLVVI